MEEFIFKYSTVPKKFIKDLFDMNSKYKYGEKYADLESINRWIGGDLDKIKEMVINNFESDIDYIVSNEKLGDSIKISTNIFKELCVMIGTDKSKQARKYYISIEKMINNYDIHHNLDQSKDTQDRGVEFAVYDSSAILNLVYIAIMIIYIIYTIRKML